MSILNFGFAILDLRFWICDFRLPVERLQASSNFIRRFTRRFTRRFASENGSHTPSSRLKQLCGAISLKKR
jgi:hypothetical protein